MEACLRRLAKGATLEECLAAYPHNRAALEPLLRTALELSAAVPPSSLPTPEQIARMQTKVINGVAAQSKITRFPNRTVMRFGLMAAGISLILSGYVVLNMRDDGDGETHGEARVSTTTDTTTNIPTTPPTIIALAPTQTATDVLSTIAAPIPSVTASSTTRPSETPPPTITDTVTPPPQSRWPVGLWRLLSPKAATRTPAQFKPILLLPAPRPILCSGVTRSAPLLKDSWAIFLPTISFSRRPMQPSAAMVSARLMIRT